MTVAVVMQEFLLVPTNHSPAFEFPLGQWEAVGVAIGDATGGGVTLTHTFTRQYMWSVEGWNMTETLGGSPSDFSLTWAPNNSGTVAWHTMGSGVNDTLLRAVTQRDSVLHLPVAMSERFDTLPQVIAGAEVNTNLEIYRSNAWGYYWDKRARQQPGGLRRPT